MSISVYNGKEAADSALATPDKLMKARKADIKVAFEGDIKAFYQTPDIYAETI